MIRIVLDADGVIFNFLEPFKEIASQITQREIREINSEWSLQDRFAMTKNEVNNVFCFFNDQRIWSGLPILKGADDAIHSLRKNGGIEMLIVSSMPLQFAKHRKIALHRYGINLPVIAVGVGNSKEEMYDLITPDVVIDDYMKHLDEAYTVGVPNRVLIESCLHKEDKGNATASFKSLIEAVPYIKLLEEQYAKST